MTLRSNGSTDTCISEGVATFLRYAFTAHGMFGMRAYVGSDISTLMPRAILWRLKRQ